MISKLSKAESLELVAHERTIERGKAVFLEVGDALAAIRERKLWRDRFGSFDAYCRERWSISNGYASRLINASDVAKDLAPIGFKPQTERQMRPLVRLDHDKRREAMRKAQKISRNNKPTAKVVEIAAAIVAPKPTAVKPIVGAVKPIVGGRTITILSQSTPKEVASALYRAIKRRDFIVELINELKQLELSSSRDEAFA